MTASSPSTESIQIRLRVTKEAVDQLHRHVLQPHFDEVRNIVVMWAGGNVVAAEHETRRAAIDFDEYVHATLLAMNVAE